MASITDKTCQGCKTPFTGDGKGKEYKGYHTECLKCSLCEVQMDFKNISLRPSKDCTFCNACDSIFSSKDFKNCLRCQQPLADNEGSSECYCNECKGRHLSAESLTQPILAKEKSQTTLDAVKSEECIWYDCSSRSFNTIPNVTEKDKNIVDQKVGPSEKGNRTSKNRGDTVQMGYRDLHGRASKDSLTRNQFPSAYNVSYDGESPKMITSATPTIQTSAIPLRTLGNSSYLKQPSTICSTETGDVKVPFSQTTATATSKDTTSNKGQKALNSTLPSPTTSGASPTAKPRFNLRIPSKLNIPTTTIHNPEATTDSQTAASPASDGQNISQSPEDTTKPKTFKNVIRSAFTKKCSRREPVKAFPTGPDTKGSNETESALAAVPCKENENSLAKASKEKNFFLDCSICFDSLLDNGDNKTNTPPSSVVATKCGHIFHEKCIKEWLKAKSHKKCPICCSSCSSSNLLTIFVDAGPQRLGNQTNISSITEQELDEIHETLQRDFEDLKLKYDKLEAEHDLCGWKSVVIQSLQSAFDLESHRRQELERENEHLLGKIQNMQLEAFVRQSSGLAPIGK